MAATKCSLIENYVHILHLVFLYIEKNHNTSFCLNCKILIPSAVSVLQYFRLNNAWAKYIY